MKSSPGTVQRRLGSDQSRKSLPARSPLRVVGLFAGIGGIELGLARAGHQTELLCEIEPSAIAVLENQFGLEVIPDVRDIGRLPGNVDLVTAGFPCQDLSQAGRTAGIEGSKSGLVGEVFRLLREDPVEWLLIENVPFMLQLAGGKALEVIVSSLEDLGYKWAYRVVNTRAFGLPQRRERVYLLASRSHDPREVLFVDEAEPPVDARSFGEVACGFYWTEGLRGLGWAVDSVPTLKGGSTIGIPSPPAIIFPSGFVGKPHIRDAERMQGFTAGWTEPAEQVAKRGHRWKLVGNAVTVDVAAWIGNRLREPLHFGGAGVPLVFAGRWPRSAWNVGDGRFAADLSAWPVARRGTGLADFLDEEVQPLSEKACRGFLSRAERASLRFPPGFLEALAVHLDEVSGTRRRAVV
jgi:DNA (cytosine-5)-methyltransferase 1